LADRIERALASASAARTAEIQRLPDNPLDVELRTFGDLRARRVGRELAYYPYFNGPFDPRGRPCYLCFPQAAPPQVAASLEPWLCDPRRRW
jgi:hypothetical protein